jgi:DNA-binding transcriptional LysR family regulator
MSQTKGHNGHSDALLRRGLKLTHLRLLAQISDTGQLGQAAARLGVTQPAASRLLAEVEQIVGQKVHERSGRGIWLLPPGEALARRALRVQIEMAEAERELETIRSGRLGHVRVGAVTAPALELVLPAIRAARIAHPSLTVEVDVSPSAELCTQLLADRLDIVLGRLPEGKDRELLDMRPIGPEPVALIVRRGHGLLGAAAVTLADLKDYDWVMPSASSPIGRAVGDRLSGLGFDLGQVRVTTASFLFTLALLRSSNAIAPLARAVADRFATGADTAFAVLPVDLGIVVPDFGLVTRRGTEPTPATARMTELILAQATSS